MILYHGSNIVVEKPEIRIPNRNLDFGMGFYTTFNKEQALAFASSVVKRNRNKGIKTISMYEVDMEILKQDFKTLEFDKADGEWLDFVSKNRVGDVTEKDYDLIIGPVANDTIFRTFVAYSDGFITREQTIERLKVSELYNQVTFKNNEILKCLKFIGSEEIK